MRTFAILAALAVAAIWATVRFLPTATTSAEAAADAVVRPDAEVRSVALDGRRLPVAELRGVLETRPGQPLDPARLTRDRDAMERALADQGYLAARVTPAAVAHDADGAAYVTFEVDPGRLFQLRSVAVTGPGKDIGVVTLSPGEPASRDRIERARQGLIEGLARRGKRAAVELSVRSDLAAAAVDVVLATR